MSFVEIINANKLSQSLPARARDALTNFDTNNITVDAVYTLTTAARQAGAATLAHQLLEAGASEFKMKADLRYKLEVAQNLAASNEGIAAHELLRELQVKHRENWHAFRVEAELYVREGNYDRALALLCDAPLSDTHSAITEDIIFRAVRLKIYLTTIRMGERDSRRRFEFPTKADAIERAVAILMIRDEDDIIGQNLLHHYRLGIRKFVIVLNRCADQTAVIVKSFQVEHSDTIICTITDPVEGYYQASKTQSAFEFARSYFAGIQREVEWCFILDADEFISIGSEVGLAELIRTAESANKNFISFHLCNSCPSSGHEYQSDMDVYSHFDTVIANPVPVVIKNGFRAAIGPRIAMGNHSLYYNGIRVERCLVAAEYGARLVHLPYRSAAQIRTKIVNGGSAYMATSLHESLGLHWRRLYKDYLDRGEVVLSAKLLDYNKSTARDASAMPKFAF